MGNIPKNNWYLAAQRYLQRLAGAEYKAGLNAHTKAGRSPKTYRHNPSQYHADLVHELGYGTEESFKQLKNEQGYNSPLGH